MGIVKINLHTTLKGVVNMIEKKLTPFEALGGDRDFR
jgi:hypothetical protein